eukprot:NODE_925_length_3041_cov_0.688987.p2 type:complete len:393 gc:universal NODE_925_length_3041_cov_0.688987:3035-1857(-)
MHSRINNLNRLIEKQIKDLVVNGQGASRDFMVARGCCEESHDIPNGTSMYREVQEYKPITFKYELSEPDSNENLRRILPHYGYLNKYGEPVFIEVKPKHPQATWEGQILVHTEEEVTEMKRQFEQLQAQMTSQEQQLAGFQNAIVTKEQELTRSLGQIAEMEKFIAEINAQQARKIDADNSDPMEIDKQIEELKQLTVRPKVNFKLDLYKPENDIDDFLIRFELFAVMNGLTTDKLMMGYLPIYMSEKCQLKICNWRQMEQYNTWKKLKQMLQKEFRDPNALRNTWYKIHRLKQGDHSVRNLYDHFEILKSKLVLYGGDAERIPNQMQIHIFIQALKPEVKERVLEYVPPPDSLLLARDIAESKESASKSRTFDNKNKEIKVKPHYKSEATL